LPFTLISNGQSPRGNTGYRSRSPSVIGVFAMRHLSVNAAIVAIVVAQLFAQEVLAFGTEEKGNKPLNKLNYT